MKQEKYSKESMSSLIQSLSSFFKKNTSNLLLFP